MSQELKSLEKLLPISLLGREQIEAAANRPVPWLWKPYVVTGSVVIVAGPAGAGKTAFLFSLLLARSMGAFFLTNNIAPAPAGQWIVIIEGEGSEDAAARRLVKYAKMIGRPDALDRILLVARESVIVGDIRWKCIQQAVKDGVVSDILLDTLASTTDAEANDEQAQNKLFRVLSSLVRSSPKEARLTLWIAAHTRKNLTGGGSDVSGSAQRIAQCDTLIMVDLVKDKESGLVKYSEILFEKLREEPPPGETAGRVRFHLGAAGITLKNNGPKGKPGPIEDPKDKILRAIAKSKEPLTRRALRLATGLRDETTEKTLENLIKTGEVEAVEIDTRTGPAAAFRSKV